MERVDPPPEHAPRLRPILDPKLEARLPRRWVDAAQPDRVSETRRRFGLGDEGDARRGDVDSRASAGQSDGGERGGVVASLKRRLLPTALCTVFEVALLLLYWGLMSEYYEERRNDG